MGKEAEQESRGRRRKYAEEGQRWAPLWTVRMPYRTAEVFSRIVAARGVLDKDNLDFFLRQGPGGYGRKEQTCGGVAQEPNKAGRPLGNVLLGLMEPAMVTGLGPYQTME